MVLLLKQLPFSACDGSIKYHLNHWKKSMAIQQFMRRAASTKAGNWSPLCCQRIHRPENYDYRENGYFRCHICRLQIDDRRYYEAPNAGIYHDDCASMRGALIEATFKQVWVQYIPWASGHPSVRRSTCRGLW